MKMLSGEVKFYIDEVNDADGVPHKILIVENTYRAHDIPDIFFTETTEIGPNRERSNKFPYEYAVRVKESRNDRSGAAIFYPYNSSSDGLYGYFGTLIKKHLHWIK